MLNPKTRRIAFNGVLAALYIVLKLVSIDLGNLKIGFSTLPVVIAVLLLGTADGCIVAAIGELLYQLTFGFFKYGFSLAFPLWVAAPVVRALCIGLGVMLIRRFARTQPERQPAFLYLTCIIAAMITTVANTLGNWLDSVIYNFYSFAYVFGDFVLRLGTGVITAAVITTISIPLVAVLRRRLITHNSHQSR